MRTYLRFCSVVSLLFLLASTRFCPVVYGEPTDTYLFITPSMCIAEEMGELFDVAVNISGVENLRSFEITITYNTSLLDVAQAVQGPYFPSPPRSYFEFEKNESLGFVRVNMSLADSEAPRSGNGTLAWISFEVIQAPESCVSSPLGLEQTLLLDSALIPIAHDLVGAVYFWKVMQPDPPVGGRLLDVYTDRGGEGPDEPGGEYMAGEMVYLTSQVTYNSSPVQQKLVAFEVRNPLSQDVAFRVDTTDQDGLAEISFRIPIILSSNGNWEAISVVEIAEETVWDTITFRVYLKEPVGGYSLPIKGYTTEKPLTLYLATVVILTAVFTMIQRKAHKRLGRRTRNMIFTIILSFLLLGFNVFLGISEGADLLITDFYSCDRVGIPQDYFPKKTTAYFNISVRNLSQDPKDVSLYLTVQDVLDVPIGSDQLSPTIPADVSTYYIMGVFIPNWAYVGVATGYVSMLGEEGLIATEDTEFYIGPEDLIPPVLHLLSPENVTYKSESVPLVFTVDERTDWIGYSLNNVENVSIAGDTTLTCLANGSYSIIVYANDTSGNVGSSEQVHFTVTVVHDVAVINIICSSVEVYIGQIVNVTVFVKNEGTVTEIFNVTAYANTTAIETVTVANQTPGKETTLIFAWNTTGVAKGNYTVRGYIPPVLNETDITDNTYIDDIINIMLPPDIAVTNVVASKTSVGQGYSTLVNVTVRNEGDYAEDFSITAYANTTVIAVLTNITITSGNSTTVTFTWNTLGFAKIEYTIWAYAWPVSGEIDTADNTYIDGAVLVTIPGDVNGDKRVDGKDIAIITKAFLARIGQPGYVPNADINCDGKIDGRDIAIATKNFGERFP